MNLYSLPLYSFIDGFTFINGHNGNILLFDENGTNKMERKIKLNTTITVLLVIILVILSENIFPPQFQIDRFFTTKKSIYMNFEMIKCIK